MRVRHLLVRHRREILVSDGPDNPSDFISTPIHDPRVLGRAGWSNAEVIWEQIQETAARCERAGDRAEAAELWRGGLELVREQLPPADLRVAASVANVAVAERRAGDEPAALRLFDEALSLWDGGEAWVESLAPDSMARSSTFHLRLRTRHPGGYDHGPRERYRALAAEGRTVVEARREGRPDETDRLSRWRRERPEGFNDWRRLLGAVLLIAPDAG